MMLGSFIEISPESKQWTRPELGEFITQVEVCLELKPGKLDIKAWSNLMLKLDDIAPFKDGELNKDLEALDQVVREYGNKLGAQE